jgi:hypothetical protein
VPGPLPTGLRSRRPERRRTDPCFGVVRDSNRPRSCFTRRGWFPLPLRLQRPCLSATRTVHLGFCEAHLRPLHERSPSWLRRLVVYPRCPPMWRLYGRVRGALLDAGLRGGFRLRMASPLLLSRPLPGGLVYVVRATVSP